MTDLRTRPRAGRSAVAPRRRLLPPMPRGARRQVLVLHIAGSVGWVGLAVCMLALGVAGIVATDDVQRQSARVGVATIGGLLVTPFALVSLMTGVLLSLGTSWGLTRYWWVLAKFVITVALNIGVMVLGPTGPRLIVLVVAQLTLLLIALVLSVHKPWGRIDRNAPGAIGHGRAHDAPVNGGEAKGQSGKSR